MSHPARPNWLVTPEHHITCRSSAALPFHGWHFRAWPKLPWVHRHCCVNQRHIRIGTGQAGKCPPPRSLVSQLGFYRQFHSNTVYWFRNSVRFAVNLKFKSLTLLLSIGLESPTWRTQTRRTVILNLRPPPQCWLRHTVFNVGNSVIKLGSLPKSSIPFHLITTEFDWNWIGNSTLICQVIVTPNGGHLVTPNGGHLVTPNSGHLVTPKERDDSVKTCQL